MKTMTRRCVPVLFVFLAIGLAGAPARADDPVEMRARDVAAMLVAEPRIPDDLFDEAFLRAVPPPQLVALCQSYSALGEVTDVVRTEGDSSLTGEFDVLFSSEQILPMTLMVGGDSAHRVVGLFFHPPMAALGSVDDIADALAALPGKVSFAVAKLLPDGPEWLVRRHGEQALAVGSAFKLYVLGELAARIAAGKLAWDTVTTLHPDSRSLSSGLHDWPAGAPLTLHTLAALMISVSENTATDLLMRVLGRKAVEERLVAMGNGVPERNRPFLTTGEMFRIKFSVGNAEPDAYLRLSEDKRRQWLEEVCPELPLTGAGTDPAALARPRYIDTIEWFASAEDLCRAMDALRRAARSDARVLDVLAINPGIPAAKRSFDYVGYKGGSETGVLAMAFLLRSGDDWYAMAVAWNDTTNAVDEGAMATILTRAMRVIAVPH